jgi:PAS domain S-box-containing protein
MNAHDLRHQIPPDSSSHRNAAQSGVELAKCRVAPSSASWTDGASTVDEIDAYRALFRAAPIGLLVSSSSGRILDASDTALRLLGLEREDAIGKTRDDIGLLPLEWGESQKEASGVFEVAVSRDVESKVKLRSGEVRDVIVSIGPVHMHNETCVVTTLVDVTERFAARDRRAVSERLASVATLGAGVASQIDNPMTCVTTYLELLADHISKLGDGHGEQSEPVETMKALVGGAMEGAGRVAAVVERMHMLSRAEERRRTPLDVAEVVDAAVDAVQGELRNRARLVKTYGTSPTVVADEASLQQVFMDLLVNAARAITAGHPEDNEVSVSVGREGERAVVRIRDTGPGMGPETQQRIFDPFFSTRPSGSSPGLGLSICDRIVSELGGEISIESKPGAGTSVRVALPARATKAGPFAANAARPFPLKTRRTRGRVLLVDDDPATGEELQRALSDHDVSVAQTADAALEYFASGVRFDAIVCSLSLPGMTGMDLYEQVILRTPELCRRMVFLRGGVPSRDASDFLERIPNRRLDKPCDASALLDAVAPLLP